MYYYEDFELVPIHERLDLAEDCYELISSEWSMSSNLKLVSGFIIFSKVLDSNS